MQQSLQVKSEISPATLPPVQPTAAPTDMTRENSIEAEAREGSDEAMVNAPMASLYEVTKLRNVRSDPWARAQHPSNRVAQPDFIAQGRFDLQEAERLFARFCETLNEYLWGGIALVHETLDGARSSSPLLTASILASTALHAQDGGRAFDIVYPIFLELVSRAMFDRYHSLDDVRGLCIGAFYLSDLSWKLSGLAVRIATELNLHQFCAMALRNRPEHVREARLWYLLYVCDHHFSIAYGRPPVISENASLTYHEEFLRLPGITQSDHRLHSQVGIFIILSRIYHVFGPDRSRLIVNDEFDILRRFDTDLTNWRDQWKPRLAPNPHIADYPAKGVLLHYHFARMQLFAICLRGLKPSEQYTMSNERREFVNLAVASAFAALELILQDPDMRRAVIGVPLYLLTTIAYASLFLMKAQTQWRSANLDVRYEDVVSTVEGTVRMLEETRPCVRHVAHYLGRGLHGMLKKFQEHAPAQSGQSGQPVPGQPFQEGVVWPDINNWMFTAAPVAGQFGVEQEQPYELHFLDVLSSQMPG